MKRYEVVFSLSVAFIGLLCGLLLHFLTVYMRDYGPAFGDFSLRGNGAIIFLLLPLLLLLLGEVWSLRRRAWLGAVLLPCALFAGLFLLVGGI